MKRLLRALGFLVLLVLVLVLSFVAYLEITGIPKYEVEKVDFPTVQVTPERVAMGEKIASVQCIVCHRGSDGKLSGRLLRELPPEFGEIHSANITQSKEHGIGKWTDEQIAYLLRTGCKPDGQYLPIYMPKFAHLSDEDLKSVIAFLRSDRPYVQASDIDKVPSKPSLLVKFLCHVAFKKIPYPKAAIPEPDTTNAVAYGSYLVNGRYDCYTCHSKDFTKLDMEHPEKSLGYMGGGNTLITLEGKIRYSANITMCTKTGIGNWSEEDLGKALREHKNKDGKTIREPMLPYTGLTDLEVKSIWQYIQTVPVIVNQVDRKWDQD
jgi:mono/diheme cytochrome c family protein